MSIMATLKVYIPWLNSTSSDEISFSSSIKSIANARTNTYTPSSHATLGNALVTHVQTYCKTSCLPPAKNSLIITGNQISSEQKHAPNETQTACSQCQSERWIFQGTLYDEYLSRLYAEKDGCFPSNVKLHKSKFLIPWRYRNRKTGHISWKIYHLSKDLIEGPDSEIITVNAQKDVKLAAIIAYVESKKSAMKSIEELVEFMLKVIRKVHGDYGIKRFPAVSDADASLFDAMKRQGHNFMLLCQVPIGVCRHKALLFKILCDAVGVECALITGYSTGGRHQWNIITTPEKGNFLIDPTSKHFSWTSPGSLRTKGYKLLENDSLGHAGFTQKANRFI